MAFPRYTESQLRDLLRLLDLPEAADPETVAKRLEQLRRGLAPEDEFALMLNWLGRCRLIHKLGQEQLPIESTADYRVPDFLAVFERPEGLLPVLIEVKSTSGTAGRSLDDERLSLKPSYLSYANLLRVPMLVAWHHESFWYLFDMRVATKKGKNYRIGLQDAVRNNLLGVLGGDFAYGVTKGSALVIRMKTLNEHADDGTIEAIIQDTYFTDRDDRRIEQNIPELLWLFMTWDNTQVQERTDDGFLLKFVADAPYSGEFASRTFRYLAHALRGHEHDDVNWRALGHDSTQFAHQRGRFRELISECHKIGIVSRFFEMSPAAIPDFLR